MERSGAGWSTLGAAAAEAVVALLEVVLLTNVADPVALFLALRVRALKRVSARMETAAAASTAAIVETAATLTSTAAPRGKVALMVAIVI